MTMLEKMAAAIDDALSDAFHADRALDPVTLARAALQAIRDPTGCVEWAMRHDDEWRPSMWMDCIDAILAESDKTS